MTSVLYTSLSIRGLELVVHLGWPDNERSVEQMVWLDIDIFLPDPPKACVTDKLEDTYCYSTLTTLVREKIKAKTFHLIEHLNYHIYHAVKPEFPKDTRIIVRLTKHPHIEGLSGGVSFTYGDTK